MENSGPTIGEFLKERFARNAMRTALVHGEIEWTYAQLAEAAQGIARAIVSCAAGRSEPVAVLLEKSPEFVAAWCGVLQSGMIVVAIDPTDPPERIRQLLEDCGARMAIVSRALETDKQSELGGRETIFIEDIKGSSSDEFVPIPRSTRDPSMLLYTSGSTGVPKGVVYSDRILFMLARRFTEIFGITENDCVAHTSNTGFAISTNTLLSALANGATLHLHDVRKEPPETLAESLRREKITCMHITSTVMRQIAQALGPGRTLDCMRTLRLGGEPLFRRDVLLFRQVVSKDCILMNGYGASELNPARTLLIPSDMKLESETMPAGHKIDGVDVHLLDEEGRPVPDGEVGEICLQSAYVALGYWRRPEETNTVFVPAPDPSPERGEFMYRTGDLGRLRADGCLEVLGRRDQQVKIRGVRIEVAEIERVLMEHAGIEQAVVVKCGDEPGAERLAAFWIPKDDAEIASLPLRMFVASRIPAAMVPSSYHRLNEFPLTPTGKINRTALRELARSTTQPQDAIVPPLGEIEEALLEIWEETLNARPIGVTDHFFELGGHSLLALQVIEKISRRLKVELQPEAFLRSATIRGLAREIDLHASSTFEEQVLTIHASGEGTPLWVIGSHRKSFFEYAALLEVLPRDRPIRMAALNVIEDDEFVLRGVENAAAQLAQVIMQVQPEGKLIVLGHCMGGMIALEIARWLAESGRDVSRAFILDPPAIRAWLEPLKRVVARWGRTRNLPLERQIGAYLRLRARAIRMEARLRNWRQWISPKRVVRRLALKKKTISSGGAAAHSDTFREQIVLAQEAPTKVLVARAHAQATLTDLGDAALRGYHPVMRLHFPKRYQGAVTVVRAMSSKVSQQPYGAWRRGWERFGGDQLQIRPIQGDHQSILRYPDVRGLAECIKTDLDAS